MTNTLSTDMVSLLDGPRRASTREDTGKPPQGDAFRKTVAETASEAPAEEKEAPAGSGAGAAGLAGWPMAPEPEPEAANSDAEGEAVVAAPDIAATVTAGEAVDETEAAKTGDTSREPDAPDGLQALAGESAGTPEAAAATTRPEAPKPETAILPAERQTAAPPEDAQAEKAAPDAPAAIAPTRSGEPATLVAPEAAAEAERPKETARRADAPVTDDVPATLAGKPEAAGPLPGTMAVPAQAEGRTRSESRHATPVPANDDVPDVRQAGSADIKPRPDLAASTAPETATLAQAGSEDSAALAAVGTKDGGLTQQPIWAAGQAFAPAAGMQTAASPLIQMMAASPQAVMVAAPAEIVDIVSGKLGADKGQDRLLIQLDPPELGRISIDFKFDANGLQHVVVTGESPEALRQLRQLHFQLTQTLEQHGLTGQDMTFRQQGSQQQGQQGNGAFAPPADGIELMPSALPAPALMRSLPSLSGSTRLNIKL